MIIIFKFADKIAGFKAKLELWGQCVNKGILDMFHTLAGIFGDTDPEPSFFWLVHDHLSLLSKEFERYFPTTKDPKLVRNGFETHLSTSQANLVYPWKKKINCLRSQMMVT